MNTEAHTAQRGGWLERLLLVAAAVFYASGFLHPRADFPNRSPWMDWSKMTDEGWYGGAAIHHFVWGHWYLADSFNPAVAMPVWPAMLTGWFWATGVSLIAARVLTMVLYGASLWLLYQVVRRATTGVWAALAVAITAVNPFCWAFDRLAVLEPVTVFWMMLGLWLAGGYRPPPSQTRDGGHPMYRLVCLGVVLGLLVLTKTTGVALVPAVLYLLWAEMGWPLRWGGWLPRLLAVAVAAAVVWLGYFALAVRPHYLADYHQLFSINGYSAHLSILPRMLAQAVWDGLWINPVLFPAAIVVIVLSAAWLRELWRTPLFGAAVLAMAGHIAFVGYHTNFQPRYYLVVAMPMAIVLALGLAALGARLAEPALRQAARWPLNLLVAAVLVTAGMMAVETLRYVTTPEYSFLLASQSIAAVIRADTGVKPLLLSDSGDEITLLTGVPSLCDAYALHGEEALLDRYKPGWFAAWPSNEGDILQHIADMGRRYRLEEVAHYRVFDDPTRDQLVLYRLTPR